MYFMGANVTPPALTHGVMIKELAKILGGEGFPTTENHLFGPWHETARTFGTALGYF